MASAIHFLTSFSRRLTTLGWKCNVAASLALLLAASVIFGFSAPSPVTARLSFSPSDANSGSHDIKPVNFTGNVLAAPPLDMEISISPTSLSMIPPSPAPAYNSTNMLEHRGGDPDRPPSQVLPYVSTTVLSPANSTLSPSPELSIKSKEPVTLTEVDRELIYAKMEITNALPISHDLDLHAPLFKNVSAFKRSYELMKKYLKCTYIEMDEDPYFTRRCSKAFMLRKDGSQAYGGKYEQKRNQGSKELGIPTANLSPEDVPSEHRSGIYFGWAGLPKHGIFKMVMSIGWNLHFDNPKITIEPWLLHEFKDTFYGELRLVIVGYIRPQAKFSSDAILIEKIQRDRRIAEKALDLPLYAYYQNDEYLTTQL